MRNRSLIAAGVSALALMAAPAQADWLDDVTDSVKDGLNRAGDSIDRTLGEGGSDGNADGDAEAPGEEPDTEAEAPERVKEPTDPKLRRVQNVRPVNRVAHSTVDGLRVRSLPGTDTAVAGSIFRRVSRPLDLAPSG